jgi:hypothetical protein
VYLIRCGMTVSVPSRRILSFFVVLEVALEPFDMAVALEGEHVGGDAIEKPAVVLMIGAAVAMESKSAASRLNKLETTAY